MADPYQTLGVGREATQEEIRAAYRRLAKKYHPDLHPGDKGAEARFKEIASGVIVAGSALRGSAFTAHALVGGRGPTAGGSRQHRRARKG